MNDAPNGTSTPPGRQLRLALAMRGGVSLAVWIGGCVGEIDRLRRDLFTVEVPGAPAAERTPTSNALARLARHVGVDSVAVDVMSGASAGGLNAVLYGTALASGAPVATLRETWKDVADLERLQRRVRSKPSRSLFDGDYFRRQLQVAIVELLDADPSPGSGPGAVERLDVVLSVTSVVPTSTTTAIDITLPEVEERVDAEIRLQHRAGSFSDFVAIAVEPVAAHAAKLALAGRATAAFPVAFAPVPVPSDSPLHPRVHARPRVPDPLHLYDGGVVDNMPVGKAARAIETAPADGPTTRHLLYLFPSPGGPGDEGPGAAPPEADQFVGGAGPVDVARSALRSLRGKSLAEDLRGIEAHNSTVQHQLSERRRLLATEPFPAPGGAPDHEKDVARLVDLLVDPAAHLDGLVPTPQRAPVVSGRTGAELAQVRRVALSKLETLAKPEDLPVGPDLPSLALGSLRPWSSTIRTASLLIEWCRELEASELGDEVLTEVGAAKAGLYASRQVAYELASELNRITLDELPDDQPFDPGAVGAGLIVARSEALADPEAGAGAAAMCWADIVVRATEVADVLPDGWVAGDSVLGNAFSGLLAPGADVSSVLDRIDRVLLPLHRGAPQGSLATIDYRIISGQAPSPLANGYQWPLGVADATGEIGGRRLVLKSLRPRDTAQQTIDPASKLAGNQLGNFAAFLDGRWRENDWMWGRLDSVPTLVGVLLDPSHPPTAEQVRRIVCGLGDDGLPVAGDETKRVIDREAARIWGEIRCRVEAELAVAPGPPLGPGEPVAGSPAWPATRAVLTWRRQAEIFAEERPGSPSAAEEAVELPAAPEPADPCVPITSPPLPESSLSRSMAGWDDDPRVLVDKWGEAKTSAIAMRSASVAWRTLFERTGLWAVLRVVLSPLVMWLAGLFVGRRRSVVALELVLVGVVLPRSVWVPPGRVVVPLLVLVLGMGGLAATARRPGEAPTSPIEWCRIGSILVAMVIAVVGGLRPELLEWSRPPAGEPWREGWWALRDEAWFLVPTVAMGLAAAVSWFWAGLLWRVPMTLVNAAVVGGWVVLAARAGAGPEPLRAIGSMYWCLLIAVPLLYTLVTFNLDVFIAKPPPNETEAEPDPPIEAAVAEAAAPRWPADPDDG